MIAVMVLGMIISLLGYGIAGILMPMINMLATAFLTVFVVRLSTTILSNAR